MKHIIISDIHGRSVWKDIIAKEQTFDKVIFIGDYFDSFDISPITQIDNFQEILDFKKEHNDKVITLIGNHDYHYLNSTQERYSGYNNIIKTSDIVEENKDVFQVAYQYNNYLMSHAGISQEYLTRLQKHYKGDETSIPNILNDILLYSPQYLGFANLINNNTEYPDQYGNRTYQSPLWIRPQALAKSPLKHHKGEVITQIIGHTQQERGKITISNNIIHTDTYDNIINNHSEYITITNNTININTI